MSALVDYPERVTAKAGRIVGYFRGFGLDRLIVTARCRACMLSSSREFDRTEVMSRRSPYLGVCYKLASMESAFREQGCVHKAEIAIPVLDADEDLDEEVTP